jgi:hypothetical protein
MKLSSSMMKEVARLKEKLMDWKIPRQNTK